MELTSPSFTVRRATAADAAAWSAAAARMFTATFAAMNTADDMAMYLASAFSRERQAREIAEPGSIVFLAERANEIIGFAHLRLGAAHADIPMAKPAEIARIYADTRFHGLGLGRDLMLRCVDAANAAGAKTLWLGVFENNARAIAFYEKHGFRGVGSQTFVVGTDPQRDLVMARDL